MRAPRFAVISDLHANLEAAEVVFADIERERIHDIVCLGDIVGYGPNPCEVVDLVRRRVQTVVSGNHDWAVLHQPVGFNPIARAAVQYTRDVLQRGQDATAKKRRGFLGRLPLVAEDGPFTFVHGTLRDPITEYCFADRSPLWDPRRIEELFQRIGWICFCGHTHVPAVIRDDKHCWYPDGSNAYLRLERGRKYIVNAGSVGQPRDGDPRACYAIFDGSTARYRRVAYAVEKTRRKIVAIEALDNRLADRLLVGH